MSEEQTQTEKKAKEAPVEQLNFVVLQDLRNKLSEIRTSETYVNKGIRAVVAEKQEVYSKNMEYVLYNLDCILGTYNSEIQVDKSTFAQWDKMSLSTKLERAIETVELGIENRDINMSIRFSLSNARTFLRKELHLIES